MPGSGGRLTVTERRLYLELLFEPGSIPCPVLVPRNQPVCLSPVGGEPSGAEGSRGEPRRAERGRAEPNGAEESRAEPRGAEGQKGGNEALPHFRANFQNKTLTSHTKTKFYLLFSFKSETLDDLRL
ncbi:hypothetical protein E3U43_008975 [Larimichthys crocea]|uniref:Uncharacterized protein n=1 Tax=Larimichthys crocea TaxID=215358 RepID=A0ACD3RW18_LARCR|nr:hypothetical protein E3U43_008975 [Larimichthys crocea]